MRTARTVRRAAALGALLAALLGGCDEAKRGLSFTLEVAPASCDGVSVLELECARVRVCPEGALDSDPDACFPVASVTGGHDADARAVYVSIGADARVNFDTKLGGARRFDIEITGYDAAGDATAVAVARGVSASGEQTVRAYPVGTSACASAQPPRPRALHHVIALPSGDAVVLGGVTGDGVGGQVEAPFQSAVEYFRARDGRFIELDVEVERVLGAAFLVPGASGSEEARIRLLGGFTRAEGAASGAAVRFGNAEIPDIGTPLEPSRSAATAAPLDLVVNTRTLRARTEVPDTVGVPHQGWLTADVVDGAGALLGYVPLRHSGGQLNCWDLAGETPCVPGEEDNLFDIVGGADASGAGRSTLRARLGATATTVGDGTLVWGGTVSRTAADRSAFAGAWSAGADVPFVAVADPTPTLFHTATTIGDPDEPRVLLVGGSVLGCVTVDTGDCASGRLTAGRAPDASVRVVSFAEEAPSVGEVMAPSYGAGLFHAATSVTLRTAEGVDKPSVLVSGGTSVLDALSGRFSAAARAQLVWMTVNADGAVVPVTSLDADPDVPKKLPGMLGEARWGHAATVLGGDRVLVTGGFSGTGALGPTDAPDLSVVRSAELFWVRPDSPAAPAGACSDADAGPP